VESEVTARIGNYADDFSVPRVDILPLATTISGDLPIPAPRNVTATAAAEAGIIDVAWAPVSVPDLTGYLVYYALDGDDPYEGVGADQGPAPIAVSQGTTSLRLSALPPGGYAAWVTAIDPEYGPESDDPTTLVNDNQTSGHESWFSQGAEVTVAAGGSWGNAGGASGMAGAEAATAGSGAGGDSGF
jgi:hypothetical protein